MIRETICNLVALMTELYSKVYPYEYNKTELYELACNMAIDIYVDYHNDKKHLLEIKENFMSDFDDELQTEFADEFEEILEIFEEVL